MKVFTRATCHAIAEGDGGSDPGSHKSAKGFRIIRLSGPPKGTQY